MKVDIVPEFECDSDNYDVLVTGVEKVAAIEGLTCEIGLRRGGGSFHIMETLRNTQQNKTHIAIDPYGHIAYPEGDAGEVLQLDYTNDMRNMCLINMYLYCRIQKMPFLFFNLEDTEFFTRFADGVPVYNEEKQLINQYAFVHFDGPHTVRHVETEIDFFHSRSPLGAVWVFDDVALYNHSEIDAYLQILGWSCYQQTTRKWAYTKTRA
jgi:hypothetical protein